MSTAALSSRIPRSESLEGARQKQESDEMEDAQVDFCCCTERSVPGGTRNLRYGVINCVVCEPVFTLGIFPSLLLRQYRPSTTDALGALSVTLISITSGPSECADLWKRAFPLAS